MLRSQGQPALSLRRSLPVLSARPWEAQPARPGPARPCPAPLSRAGAGLPPRLSWGSPGAPGARWQNSGAAGWAGSLRRPAFQERQEAPAACGCALRARREPQLRLEHRPAERCPAGTEHRGRSSGTIFLSAALPLSSSPFLSLPPQNLKNGKVSIGLLSLCGGRSSPWASNVRQSSEVTNSLKVVGANFWQQTLQPSKAPSSFEFREISG